MLSITRRITYILGERILDKCAMLSQFRNCPSVIFFFESHLRKTGIENSISITLLLG